MTALVAAALLVFGILGLVKVVSALVLSIVCIAAGALIIVGVVATTGISWPRRKQ